MADYSFNVGDTVRVTTRNVTENKIHATAFEGIVIARNKRNADQTFTVRKIAADKVAVERIFPLNSPVIETIKLVKKGKVRRAKIYHLRHGSAKP